MRKLIGALVCCASTCCVSARAAEVQDARDLTDFSADLPQDDANLTVSFRLKGIRKLPQGAGSVHVQLQRRGGKWAEVGHQASTDYNQPSPNVVEIRQLEFDGTTLGGTLKVTVKPDTPRPGGKPNFPNPPDEFELTIAAKVQPGSELPYQEDPMAFVPPWRKKLAKFGGPVLAGTYKGKWGAQDVAGELLGSVNHAPVPGVFGAQGNVVLRRLAGGGVALTARLAPKRVASPEGAYIVKEWKEPADWRKYDGLRLTVNSPRRRHDACVAIGLREANGSWYDSICAAPLTGKEAVVLLPFGDLRRTSRFDDNGRLDLEAIVGLRLGVENPLGVGEVEFSVRKVELVRWGAGAGQGPVEAVVVRVEPEVVLSFNGADTVPKGLLGYHDEWRDIGSDAAKVAAVLEHAAKLRSGFIRYIQHVGFAGKPITDDEIKAARDKRLADRTKPTGIFFQRAEAADAVDQVMVCHTTDFWSRAPWMDQDRKVFLDNVRAFYRRQGAAAWVPGDDYNLLRRFEVWNEPFMWGRHINMGPLTPAGRRNLEDPTQYGYIPGQLGAEVYAETFLAAVEGLKSVNPHALIGGPCSPSFLEDYGGQFENYTRRILDRIHGQLDFLTEHHYQGDPPSFAAGYHAATAYLDVKFGKRLPIYNTECNDLTDTPTKGEDGGPPPWHLKADELNRAHYNVVDILSCLRSCPDVAQGRAIYALWSGFHRKQGETDGYLLLSPLRGKMLAVEASDPAVICAASAPGDGRVVLVLFNNSPFPRSVRVPVTEGFEVTEGLALIFEDGTKLKPVATGFAPGGRELAQEVPARGGLRYEFRKAHYQPARVRRLEQSFCDVMFAQVAVDRPAAGKVVWRGEGPVGAREAFLRVVTRGVARDAGLAVLGGRTIPLPWSSGNDGCARIQDLPVDPATLKPETPIEFRIADPERGQGFTVWSASIVTIR